MWRYAMFAFSQRLLGICEFDRFTIEHAKPTFHVVKTYIASLFVEKKPLRHCQIVVLIIYFLAS
jgi:hypothetical protein